MKKNSSALNPYRSLAAYLRALEPLLNSSDVSGDLSVAARRLSRYLSKAPLDDIESVLATKESSKSPGPQLELVLSLDNDQIMQALSAGKLSRRELEVLATQRFGVPSGSMRSFKNLHVLGEKIRSMIENENAHKTIREAANRG